MLTGGYWDGFLVAPFAVRRDPPRRVAMLGFAGGTVARAYARYFPAARIDGVEIDSELFDIGRRYFGLRPRPQLHEYARGRAAVPAPDRRPLRRHLPRHLPPALHPVLPLDARVLRARPRRASRPAACVVVNLGHPEGSDALEKVLSATMGTAFTHVARDPMEPTNTILMASRVADHAREPARGRRAGLPEDLRPLAQRSAARLAPRLRGGAVYTDDKAPVEWLVDKSIVEYAAGGGG